MFGINEKKIEKWKQKGNAGKILKAMRHKDKSIRIAVIKAASSLAKEEILNTLIIFLRDDPDPEIRINAAEALGSIGNPRAQDHLAYVAKNDSDEKVREKAQEAVRVIISKKLKHDE
ncbi:MAG: HEAT repeat domain-containing protein [Clostridiaceae bacterium]|nr:HEAT repeat domain-containing protein [Clostridiaceae bacterium]